MNTLTIDNSKDMFDGIIESIKQDKKNSTPLLGNDYIIIHYTNGLYYAVTSDYDSYLDIPTLNKQKIAYFECFFGGDFCSYNDIRINPEWSSKKAQNAINEFLVGENTPYFDEIKNNSTFSVEAAKVCEIDVVEITKVQFFKSLQNNQSEKSVVDYFTFSSASVINNVAANINTINQSKHQYNNIIYTVSKNVGLSKYNTFSLYNETLKKETEFLTTENDRYYLYNNVLMIKSNDKITAFIFGVNPETAPEPAPEPTPEDRNNLVYGISCEPSTQKITAPLTKKEFDKIVKVCKEKNFFECFFYPDYYVLTFCSCRKYRYPKKRENVLKSVLNKIDYVVKKFI